jgi:NAD-dependent deacetylase
MSEYGVAIQRAAEWIAVRDKVVVFSGAGLSTESGIPDFRSPGGVWDRYDPEDFSFQNFVASERSRERYWQLATEMYETIRTAKPNSAHLAIAELERLGRLDCVITQNIDGLHLKAGNSEGKVIQLHGTSLYVTCLECNKRYERDPIQDRIARGDRAPHCDACGGPLKPATVSFGQSMPFDEMQEAGLRSSACEIFIVIGSSLVVYPAASFPLIAKQNGARLIIINREETPFDATADLVIHGEAGEAMSGILQKVKKMITDHIS